MKDSREMEDKFIDLWSRESVIYIQISINNRGKT